MEERSEEKRGEQRRGKEERGGGVLEVVGARGRGGRGAAGGECYEGRFGGGLPGEER